MDKYLDIERELKTVKQEGDGDLNYCWCDWNRLQSLGEQTG